MLGAVSLVLLGFHLTESRGNNETSDTRSNPRSERLLFQITSFPKSECEGSGGDIGTCMSAAECHGVSGVISGTCASSFGACCLKYMDTCGGTVTHNRTHIRNPGYPSAYTTAGTCTWKFEKCASNICQIRLDFETNTLTSPELAANSGQCITDRGYANPVTGPNTPDHCGENTGQHMYFDAGAYNPSSSAELVYALTGSGERKWKILATMIECDSPTLPPAGCYQYMWENTGQVRSFNFGASSLTTYEHLRNQYYNVCIRRNKKYCKIGWVQSDDSNSFKVSRNSGSDPTSVPTFGGRVGTACNADSVSIPGGSNGGFGQCSDGTLQSVDKYCGGHLNCFDNVVSPAEIVSSVTPFRLGVHFNSGEPDGSQNRGFCLNYRQILC